MANTKASVWGDSSVELPCRDHVTSQGPGRKEQPQSPWRGALAPPISNARWRCPICVLCGWRGQGFTYRLRLAVEFLYGPIVLKRGAGSGGTPPTEPTRYGSTGAQMPDVRERGSYVAQGTGVQATPEPETISTASTCRGARINAKMVQRTRILDQLFCTVQADRASRSHDAEDGG